MNLLEKYQNEYQDSVRINYHEPTGLYILKYLHNGVDFTDPLIFMARGLVLDSEGNIVMRAFNKFFNHRQYDTREEIPESFKSEYTHLIVPDADHEVTFWEKYDGTCITVGLYNGDYLVTTPGAIEHPQYAPRVREMLAETPQVKEWLKANPGHALVFEYISPDNLINVRYDYEALVLLAVTDIENGAKHPDVAIELGKELGFMTPTVYKMNMRQVAKIQADAKDIEGFVAVNHAGNLVKFKADDWFKKGNSYIHPYVRMDSIKSVAAVIKAMRDDTIDDMIGRQAELSSMGVTDRLTPVIDAIEDLVQETLNVSAELAANLKAANGNPELEHEVRVAFHKRRDINNIVKSAAWLNHTKGIHPLEYFSKADKKRNVARLIIDRKNKTAEQ